MSVSIKLDVTSADSYRKFLAVKRLPRYEFQGRMAIVPDEYAGRVGADVGQRGPDANYVPTPGLFDYQAAIARMAIDRRKFSVFADCGLGKTLIMLEYVRHARANLPESKSVLIVSPLMVIDQTLEECQRWYGDSMPIDRIPARDLGRWMRDGQGIGITNYDALDSGLERGRLGSLILDESSMLKSHYGKWGQECLRLGAGLDWKLALTGTPAPNDRIEYANHAVFMDAFPTVNSFLAKFFVNRGQTNERWEMKPHAIDPFYRALSHWAIFLQDPAVYGWKDNCGGIPDYKVHIHDVDLTDEQKGIAGALSGTLFTGHVGGITSRATMGQLAKGKHKGKSVETHKPEFVRALVESFGDESTIIWCLYNDEQDTIARMIPDAANVTGSTPIDSRREMVAAFQRGERKVLISKPKILGFGLNLQIATRHVFSGLQDSYESFYQAVKRSNRYGSTKTLHVHIPVTDLELPMIETVLRKAARVKIDTQEQERIFRNANS
jgi:superfamily II DNA or RNA helicase